jgi:aminoglycoside phosphotransferase (APT) family kinase protein
MSTSSVQGSVEGSVEGSVAGSFEGGLADRVSLALRRERPGLEVDALTRLPGGHSGLTYRVETSEGPLVVKSVPEHQKAVGRHDMLRQARIISALAPTDVPVPAVVATDDTEPAWFAMQLVGGESLEPVLDDPAVQPSLAAERMLRAAEVLPALHDVPLDMVPVDDLAWFDALGRYKMAAIMGHNLRRHLEGRHHDPDQERLPDTIQRLIATGLSTKF